MCDFGVQGFYCMQITNGMILTLPNIVRRWRKRDAESFLQSCIFAVDFLISA